MAVPPPSMFIPRSAIIFMTSKPLQDSTALPFSKRITSMPEASQALFVGGMPIDSPVLVPLIIATPATQSPSTGKLQPGDPPIDVNSADVAQLIRIPGVGPVTAQSILAARADRPFLSIDDLDRVRGIGPKTLDKIRPYVIVK